MPLKIAQIDQGPTRNSVGLGVQDFAQKRMYSESTHHKSIDLKIVLMQIYLRSNAYLYIVF